MPWKKGQSGNPKGRQPRCMALTDLLRARGKEVRGPGRRRNNDALVLLVWQKALAGEPWAIHMIWDRLEGKPIQRQEIDIEQRIIEAAQREGVDPQEAVETARRIIEEARWQ